MLKTNDFKLTKLDHDIVNLVDILHNSDLPIVDKKIIINFYSDFKAGIKEKNKVSLTRCSNISCFNSQYTPNNKLYFCRLGYIELNELGKCKCYRRRY